MKRTLPFIALVAALALAGCGSSSNDASGPAPAFGSKAGPRGGNVQGGGAAPAPPTPKSQNAEFGG